MTDFRLPYRYAQRSRGSTRDYVFFSAIDPVKKRMRRKRIYIDYIQEERTRERYARKLIDHINDLLDAGKNPFIDQENNKKYTTIDTIIISGSMI